MSKVYSFRLNDDNPREAQAKEVIEAWVGEGYSLRYVVTEALLGFSPDQKADGELDELKTYLEKIIDKLEYRDYDQLLNEKNEELSPAFVYAVKNAAKSGLGS